MAKYLFGEIVREVKENVDRNNNPYNYFIAGEHMDTDELHLLRRGTFAGSDVGPAFTRIFKPGQVLYGSRRTYLRKVAVADFEGITANTTFVLESKDESVLLQRLLPFIMQSERFVQHSIKRSKGSTNPYVLFSDLYDYEVELPDIEKQKELADLLWAMDSLRVSYKALLAKTDELVKSQFIEMFNLKKSQSNNWEIVPLSEVVEKPLSGEWGTDDVDGCGIKVIRTTNFTDSGLLDLSDVVRRKIDIGKISQKRLKSGDILIEKSGGTETKPVGRVVRVVDDSDDYLFNNFTAVLRTSREDVNKRYLFDFLFTNYWNGGTAKYENKTTGIHNLKLSDYLTETLISIPPVDVQDEYVKMAEQSDKSKFYISQAYKNIKIRRFRYVNI
jgi:type I restriction enzyme S subunit